MPGPLDDNIDDVTLGATRAVTRSPASPSGSSSTPSSIPFAPGAIIAGRYRLVSLLGRGGMGEVYRADDLTLDQTVALKFLPAEVATDADRLAQFHAELRIARQVSHKNVCRLYYAIVVSAVYLAILVYFGVFPMALAFLVNFILGQGGLTADLSKLYAATSVWLLVLIAGLAAFGFYASRAGEPLLGRFSET